MKKKTNLQNDSRMIYPVVEYDEHVWWRLLNELKQLRINV